MDELIKCDYGRQSQLEWKETGRWIKYEEDVEEGAEKWGRPHVASLSFHSLLELRRCIETGMHTVICFIYSGGFIISSFVELF